MAQRIWLITGVSGGLGRALAEEVANTGDIVYGTLRKADQIAAFQQINPKHVFGLMMDVNNSVQTDAAIKEIIEKHGRIDVLVNNAGYGLFGAIEEVSMEEARAQMDTNFFGVLNLTKAVLPHMRRQQSGHILQVSSVSGIRSSPGVGIYNASKYALEGFSESLSYEVAPLNIKVIIIEPGAFRTEWAGASSIRAAVTIDAYAPNAGRVVTNVQANSGKQAGNPHKAALAMIKVVNSDAPPLRLSLGADSVNGIRAKMAMIAKDLDAWEEVSLNTAFDE